MIRIIREAYAEHRVEYYINFDITRTGGFSFPCDHDGELLDIPEAAKANFERCKSGEVQTCRPPYIKEVAYTKLNYAVGECHCGAEIELRPDEEGLCYCYCGKIYNSAGQGIRPRSEWEERYDDDY